MLPAALALSLSAGASEPARRYALLVGANDGGGGRAVLQYAHRDAEGMAEVLGRLGGIDDADRRVLLDPDATGLDEALSELEAALAADAGRTEVIFYYSGHSDEEGLLLGEQHYPYADLRGRLEGLDADVRLAILDSCASGAMIRTKGGRKVAPFLVGESNQVGGFAYITSSSADEVAQEAERIGGSYFTHYLATGLRGAADRSADGRVTLDEAYAFAYEETLARTERTQHGPQHANREMNISGQGDLVLTDLQLTTASLVLEEDLVGRALVRDADGDLVAELLKPGGRAVELGLGEGHYEVTFTVDGEERYALADVAVLAGASTLLAPSDLVWHDAEGAAARGGPAAVTYPVRMEVFSGLPPGPEGGTDKVLLGLVSARGHRVDWLATALGGIEVEERSAGLATAVVWTSAGELDGIQTAVGLNHVRGDARGWQGSAGVNVARDRLEGLQTTMGVNVGGQVVGAQLGSINVAKAVTGVQLGLINVGGEVTGSQIGLINVAEDVQGVPIGLVSIVKEGRHDVLFYASESDVVNVELKLGSDHLHTIFGGGAQPGRHGWLGVGYGFTALFAADRLWLDLDGLWSAYLPIGTVRGPFSQPPTSVVKARATLGVQLAKEVALFGGAQMSFRPPLEGELVDVAPRYLADPDEEVLAWPGFFAGVQF